MNKTASIFKIFTREDWDDFRKTREFKGAPVDIADGYIHLSTGSQLQGTLDKHFQTKKPLVIAEINPGLLSDSLKWEVSRGGEDFPHYYAPLKWAHVSVHYDLSPNEKGRYDVSAIIK